jgi:hypothetical protein
MLKAFARLYPNGIVDGEVRYEEGKSRNELVQTAISKGKAEWKLAFPPKKAEKGKKPPKNKPFPRLVYLFYMPEKHVEKEITYVSFMSSKALRNAFVKALPPTQHRTLKGVIPSQAQESLVTLKGVPATSLLDTIFSCIGEGPPEPSHEDVAKVLRKVIKGNENLTKADKDALKGLLIKLKLDVSARAKPSKSLRTTPKKGVETKSRDWDHEMETVLGSTPFQEEIKEWVEAKHEHVKASLSVHAESIAQIGKSIDSLFGN